MKRHIVLLAAILALPSLPAMADGHKDGHKKAGKSGKTASVTVHSLNEQGTGNSIGSIQLKEVTGGIVLTPDLRDLTPGLHGFHVHENGSCEPSTKDGKVTPGGAAGGHLNLDDAKHHAAPWEDGHTGDMPALFVEENGTATHPVFAPGLTMKAVKDKAIIIHAGGDNYSDSPKPLGGGGARVACGVIPGK